MKTNSIIIESVTTDELLEMIRSLIKEELSLIAQKPKKYLTRVEVAELLHISLPTLAKHTYNGVIKGKQIGTRIIYDEADVRDALRTWGKIK